MSFRLARPAVLVDLGRIPGLDSIREAANGSSGEVRIGAMCRQRVAERSDLVASRTPLLAGAIPYIAHPQIRSRGTVGGSVAHADPASELPAVLTALGGRCRLQCSSGERWVAAADFFTGLFETARRDDELLVELAFPNRSPGDGWGFHEFARRHGDYALVGVAAVLRSGGAANATVSGGTVSLLSVGDGPVTVDASELAGVSLANPGEAFRELAHTIAERRLDPPGDLQASPEYRRHLATVLIRRALDDAARRALGADAA